LSCLELAHSAGGSWQERAALAEDLTLLLLLLPWACQVHCCSKVACCLKQLQKDSWLSQEVLQGSCCRQHVVHGHLVDPGADTTAGL
jgi:hypothetical protein